MNTKLLRQKVLDLAIHGKLVPQNPEHEPASKLLERIRGESLPLATAGKPSSAAPSAGSNAARNARSKNSVIFVDENKHHYERFPDGNVKDIEDKIPFEIPENWTWCRIGNIVDLINGRAYRKPELLSSGKYKVLRVGNFFTNDSWYYSDLELEDSKYCYDGDLLYAWSASFGPKIWHGEKTIFHYHIWNVKFNNDLLDKMYLYYFFIKDVDTIKESTTGSTMVHVAMENMKPRFIPLPPLEEQKLIVEEIERIFALIDTVEQNKTDLETVIKQTKSKILDLAIHGKLVPQDVTDEPASVLFEKIKKEKQLTDVDEIEELPFEIPSSWEWVHLSDVCLKLKRGKSPKYVEKSNYMAFAQKCNQKDGPTSLEKALYIDETSLNRYPPEEYMQKYDIVINSTGTGTLGRVGIYDCEVPEGIKGVFADSHVTTIHPSSYMNPKYVYYFVKCKQKYLESAGEGSTNQKELKVATIGEMEFPLPPIEEQNRIVLKIENVLQLINAI